MIKNKFNIKNNLVIITGGAGLFGKTQIEAVLENNGIAIVLDKNKEKLRKLEKELKSNFFKKKFECINCDITKENEVKKILKFIKKKYKKIDVLINNAAIDYPPQKSKKNIKDIRLETLNLKTFEKDLKVSLSGCVICSKYFGNEMGQTNGGIILNIASDLSLISPDQRLYKIKNFKNNPVKPISYSITKHGIIGLTKYLATYWSDKNVRCNALAPGGIDSSQSKTFKRKLSKLIPLGRMAHKKEYKETILFMISDASSYMNGFTMVVDGGRTIW